MEKNQGITIEDLQAKLGHKNIETTRKYLEELTKKNDSAIKNTGSYASPFDKTTETEQED